MNRLPELAASDRPSTRAEGAAPCALDDAALTALAARIRAWGRELGFGAIGISDTDLSDAEAGLAAWLEAGYHGEMDYMAKHGMKRARPAELVARSGHQKRVPEAGARSGCQLCQLPEAGTG